MKTGQESRRGYLVDIVAELALSDGPWLLMVPLESSNLRSHDGRVPVAVVIHTPVVYASQEICRARQKFPSASNRQGNSNATLPCMPQELVFTHDNSSTKYRGMTGSCWSPDT